jgi:hypothetical protein
MKVVLEPDILFTTSEKWKSQEDKDIFVENLLDILDYIDDHENINIYWSEQTEKLLWEENIHPWKQDRDFYKGIMPSISHKLHKNVYSINLDSFNDSMSCDPLFVLIISNAPVVENFYNILHNLIHKNISPNILVTKNNLVKFSLYCNETRNVFSPIVHTNIVDFFTLEDDIENSWKDLNEKNILALLDKMLIKHFPERKFLYTASISDQFIKDIRVVTQDKLRYKILNQIIKKLTLTFSDSQSDKSLKDEKIGKITGRFRVSDVMRIHYEHKDCSILFERFFPEGKHDEGIRNT